MRKRISIFALLLSVAAVPRLVAAAVPTHYYAAANIRCTIVHSGAFGEMDFSALNETSGGYYDSSHAENKFTKVAFAGNTNTVSDVSGYRFQGWYSKTGGWGSSLANATVATAVDLITANKWLTDGDVRAKAGTAGGAGMPIVFAKYIKVYQITASASPNGGGTVSLSPAAGPYDEGSKVTLTAAESNPAYRFSHWTKGGVKVTGSEGKLSLEITATEDAAYAAVFVVRTYTVTFHDSSKTYPDASQTINYGQSATAPSWSRTGYGLSWDKAFSSVTADLTVNAQWTANKYTVTFDANGGPTPSPTTTSVTYGSTYGTLATCTRTGYSLDGWYTAASGGTKIETTTTVSITAAQTLYAHWTPVSYTITYNGLMEGSTHSNPENYTVETEITFSPATNPSGYKFNEWKPASIAKGSTGNKTVSASYLTITYKPEIHSPRTYNGYSQACFQQPLPTGVVAETPGETKAVGTYTTTFKPASGYCWDDGTKTPYVVEWKITAAKITDAKVQQTRALTYTGEPQRPTVSTSATIVGAQPTWKYSMTSGGYVGELPEFTNAGDYTVYFEVSAPNYEPATGSFTVTVGRAGEASVTVSPTRLPYTKKEQGPVVTLQHCHEEGDSVTRATDIGTYKVKATPDANYAWSNGETAAREFEWSIDDSLYKVQFDGNGGTGEMASTNLAYNEEYAVPDCAFTKKGCEFQSWQVIIDNRTVTNYPAGTVVSNLTSTAGKTVTFKADWTGYYTIAFDGNGAANTVMSPQKVERDVTTNLTANAYSRTGYGFIGWDDTVKAKRYEDGAEIRNLAPVGETNTLVAAWSTNTYRVSFNPNGGTGTMADQPFAYDTAQALSPNRFTNGRNAFTGWATSAAGAVAYQDGEVVSNLTAEADGVFTLYAQWDDPARTNALSIAADCNTNRVDGRVAVNLTTGKPDKCAPVPMDDKGGNGLCVQMKPENRLQVVMEATITGPGTFRCHYKTKVDYSGDSHLSILTNTVEVMTVSETVGEWAECTFSVNSKEEVEVSWLFQMTYEDDPDYALIDNIRWIPEGGGGEPTPGDPVEVKSAGVEGNVFSLTIPTEGGTDYGVWTNADLTVDSWGLMGEPRKGDGNPWKVEWTILPEFPQLFFRAHKVEYK